MDLESTEDRLGCRQCSIQRFLGREDIDELVLGWPQVAVALAPSFDVSLYTGRGCPAQCTFCLWPQTIGGHKYRVRSAQNVADEMAYMKRLFPQVKEFFFDDDTFTANLPRAHTNSPSSPPV